MTTLDIGQYRLALIDAESGAIEQVRAFTSGKNINPQWSSDGRSLFFVSDRDGIPNLYRVGVESGEVAQLTRVATGLSGITASSPTMSVASKTNIAAFSVYEGGKIRHLRHVGAGGINGRSRGRRGFERVARRERGRAAAARSPAQPGRQRCSNDRTSFGLPPATAPATYDVNGLLAEAGSSKGWRSRRLPSAPARFGAAVGGGIALQFGDMLGDHILATAVQLNSGVTNNFSFKDTAAQALYYNQKHTAGTGASSAGRFRIFSGGFQSSVGHARRRDRRRSIEAMIFRQTEQSAAGMVAYPLQPLAARRVPGRRHARSRSIRSSRRRPSR